MQIDDLGGELPNTATRSLSQLTWSRPLSPTMTKKLRWFALTPLAISAGMRGSSCLRMTKGERVGCVYVLQQQLEQSGNRQRVMALDGEILG